MHERLSVRYRHFWKHKMQYTIERGFYYIKYKSSHPNFMKDRVWLTDKCAMASEWGKLTCKT